MKAFLAALVAVAAISGATYAILGPTMAETSEQAFTTSAVRLPQGH